MSSSILEQSKAFLGQFDTARMDQEIGMLELYQGTDPDGLSFYAYISVKPSKYAEYQHNVQNMIPMDIEEFGKIIHEGDGDMPSQEVQQMMAEKHGVDHAMPAHFDSLKQAIEQAQTRFGQGV